TRGGVAGRPFAVALAKEADLAEVGPRRRPEEPPADRVDRRGQEEVEDDPGHERVEEDEPRRDVVAEHEVEHELPDGDQHRDDREVGGRVEDADPVENRDLQDRRHEEQRAGLRRVGAPRHGSWGAGLLLTRTATESSVEKSTNGETWIDMYGSTSLTPTLVTT